MAADGNGDNDKPTKRKRERIVDVGEKFGGARKDLAVATGPRTPVTDEQEPAAELRLSKFWKRPDFRYDADISVASPRQAILFQEVYANLRARPPRFAFRGTDAAFWDRNYVRAVTFLREAYVAGLLTTRQALRTAYDAHMEAGETTPEGRKCAQWAAGRGERRIRHPVGFRYEQQIRVDTLVDLGWPDDPRVYNDDVYGVLYLQYQDPERTGWYAARGDGRYADFLDRTPFRYRDDALAVARRHFADVIKTRVVASTSGEAESAAKKKARAPVPRRPRVAGSPVRFGKAWRAEGAHIASSDEFKEIFGFRGIEFGKWVRQGERQDLLDAAHDALLDLCDILTLPRSFASLGGRLGIAFGSRGRGLDSGAAHFEPKKWLIHFTKTSGAGALAHEFGHAFDAYFFARNWPQFHEGTPDVDPYLSAALEDSVHFATCMVDDQPFRDRHLTELVRRLWKEIAGSYTYGHAQRGTTQFRANADTLDGSRTKLYWSRHTELFARAFEAWIADELEARGQRNDFLVYGVNRDVDQAKAWRVKADAYPRGAERDAIGVAFRDFLHAASEHWRAQALQRRHPPNGARAKSAEGVAA